MKTMRPIATDMLQKKRCSRLLLAGLWMMDASLATVDIGGLPVGFVSRLDLPEGCAPVLDGEEGDLDSEEGIALD